MLGVGINVSIFKDFDTLVKSMELVHLIGASNWIKSDNEELN